MRLISALAAAAGIAALAACGETAQEEPIENIDANAGMMTENLDTMAVDNMTIGNDVNAMNEMDGNMTDNAVDDTAGDNTTY